MRAILGYMSQDEFTKLCQYMMRIEKKIDEQTEIMATKDDINRILKRLDNIEK